MARLKPVLGVVALYYECSVCNHRQKVNLTLNEEIVLWCPNCKNIDHAVPVADFRLVYNNDVVIKTASPKVVVSKPNDSVSSDIVEKVSNRLRKLGYVEFKVLVDRAMKRQPKNEQELFKFALAEVEIPDEC